MSSKESPSMQNTLKPVFLHAGYRTAGTWVWSCFRKMDGVAGFYEPLHEALAGVDPRTLEHHTSDSWESRHPKLEPYFSEFRPLLRAKTPGVRGYSERLAIDRLNGEPAAEDAGDLEAYVHSLMQVASQRGDTPVFKFCRSLGRLPWFFRTFEDAVHVVIERNPISQWQSSWELFGRHRNAHFLAMPYAVLAFNRGLPELEQALDTLKVRVPEFDVTQGPQYVERMLDACKAHVARVGAQEAFRAFLVHWLLTMRFAATHAHAIFDCDLAVWSPSYLTHAEQWFKRLSGLSPVFSDITSVDTREKDYGFSTSDGASILGDALDLADSMLATGSIHNDTYMLWRNKLMHAVQVQMFSGKSVESGEFDPAPVNPRLLQLSVFDSTDVASAARAELEQTRDALERARRKIAKRDQPAPYRLLGELRRLFGARTDR